MPEQFCFAIYVENILSVVHITICNYNILINFYVMWPFKFNILYAARTMFF